MAKLTALQALNQVLKRVGEAEVSSLTSLTTIQQMAFDSLNRALQEIAQGSDLKPLETQGSATLVTGTSTYAIASGFSSIADESFRSPDASRLVTYVVPDEFDKKYPQGITTARSGYPEFVTIVFSQLQFDRTPTSAENGKIIYYRYYAVPTLYSTATSTGTSYVPEPYDNTLLVNYATWLTMSYMGHQEELKYWSYVFGDTGDRKPEGQLTIFRRRYAQPPNKARFNAVL